MTSKSIIIFCLLITIVFRSTVSYSQDFSVKKEIIMKEKVPYAKITGRVGMFKPADLLVSSLNDDSLFTIKAWSYPTHNPMFHDLAGFQIKFIKSGKEMIKSCTYGLASKDHVVDFILSDRNFNSAKRDKEYKKDLVVNNAIDPVVESEFIEQFNNEPAIQWAKEYEEKEKMILKEIFPAKKGPNTTLRFETVGSPTQITNGTEETMYIYRGEQLASLTKRKVTTSFGVAYTYTFYRILDDMFLVGDKKIGKVMIATAEFKDAFPSMFVNVDGKNQKLEITNAAFAERELTELLINNKKL